MAYMAGAILALAAVFAVTVAVQTGSPLLGAVLFPVGFVMLYLMGFDLLTGVFVLTPLALLDQAPGSDGERGAPKLGPGIRRQLCGGTDGGIHDGRRIHVRFLYRCGRRWSENRGYR